MKTLVLITGPTASGKTALAIDLARELDTEIVSADSRQIYKGMSIGTASPSPAELAAVKHHLIGVLDPSEYYSAAKFEQEGLEILDKIWRDRDIAVMCGGSMMYIDAITRGIDELPDISADTRKNIQNLFDTQGIDAIKERLSVLDPDFLNYCDPNNHRRLMHALEICIEAGKPYSQLRTGQKKERPFRIVKFAINHPRELLFERINTRVDKMIEEGLEEEAHRLYPLRKLNALNTVGYKELFAMFEGKMTREVAIPRIAKNTRVYAKKQLLWLSKDPEINRLDPSDNLLNQAMKIIQEVC